MQINTMKKYIYLKLFYNILPFLSNFILYFLITLKYLEIIKSTENIFILIIICIFL